MASRTWRAAIAAVLVLIGVSRAEGQPGAPVVGQLATAGELGVVVFWDGTEDDPYHAQEGAALGGFTLFGAMSQGGTPIARLPLPWSGGQEGESPAFIVPGVAPGTYWVVAVKGLVQAPQAPASSWQPVTVPLPCTVPPLAPTQVFTYQQPGTNIVTVRAEEPPGSCRATSWELQAGYSPGTSSAGTFQLSSHTYIGPAPPNVYFIRMRARNAYGISGVSPEVRFEVTEGAPCIGPGATRQLEATVDGNLVTLTWLPPSDPGSRPIAQYGLVAGTHPGGVNAAGLFLPGSVTSYQTTAPPGTYYVRVRATNGCGGVGGGMGPPSNEVMVVVP